MSRFMGIVAASLIALSGQAWSQADKIKVQWLGQSATKITTPSGKVIIIDPFLTKNPKTPAEYKKLEALGKVDLILVTHAHGDHFGDTPELVKMHQAPMWAPAGLAQQVATLGIVPAKLANRMSQGGTIRPFGPDDVRIVMTHALHNSEFLWKNPASDKDETHFGGEPCGFIIEFPNGFKIYHMGDTGLFADMKMIGEYYKPNLIMMPIGGGQFVMNPVDAAYATRMLRPKFVIPFHYGTNPALVGTPAEYVKALGRSSVKVFPINPGDTLDF